MTQQITPEKLARFDALLREKGIVAPQQEEIPPRPGGAPIPLTPAQRRVWALHQLAPDSPAYNMRVAEQISGRVSLPHLAQALNRIIARHEMLRTTFREVDGEPVQEVAGNLAVTIDVAATADLAAAKATATAFVRQPFDLSTLPLLRARIWQWSDTEQLLVIVSHQILFDGTSLGLLLDELKTIYAALGADREPALPPLDVQYGDYAVWAAGQTDADALAEQRAYWQAKLAKPIRPVALPYDHPRPAGESDAGSLHPFTIDPDVAVALRQLCRREGATLFVALAATVTALFYGYGAGDEVMLFTSAEGRSRPELQPLIGLLARQLVLRQPATGTMSFRELLAQAQTTIQEATANGDVAFETLVSLMELEAGHPPAGLFQVMLVLLGQNRPDAAAGTGLTWTPVHVGNQMAKFDWRLFFVDGESGLSGYLEYKTDLFDEATIARAIGELQAVLAALVARPDAPLESVLPFPVGRYRQTDTTEPAPAIVAKTGYVAPRTSLEWQLAQLWEALFDRHPIGSEDDFFALGGHSLLAVQLLARIETRFGQRLPLRTLAERPTIAGLAEALAGEGYQSRWRSLVPLHPAGDKPPLFAIPPAGRSVASFSLLAHHLDADRPLYAFQPQGLEPGEDPVDSVPAMAAAYIEEMQAVHPAGPYHLLGRCFGGLVAVEMGRQLLAQGETVALLAVVDTILPPRRGHPPAQRDASFYGRRLMQRLRRDPRRLLKRAWNSLVAEPVRNLRKSYRAARDSFVWAGGGPEQLRQNLRTWRRMMRLLDAHTRAGQRYFLANPYPGPITYFASELTPPLQSDFHWSWEALAGEGLARHTVPGDHVTMANAENVQVMAKLLTDALATAEQP